MSDDKPAISTSIPTVIEYSARKIAKLVEKGATLREAEQEVGVTLTKLRQPGVLRGEAKALLERIDDAVRAKAKDIGRAALVELALQDEDMRVKLNAAKALIDEGAVSTAIQNNHFTVQDPDILKMYMSLGLPTPEEKKENNDD